MDEKEYLECIKELIRVDKDWIPKKDKCSLYIRPHLFGTEVHHLIFKYTISQLHSF